MSDEAGAVVIRWNEIDWDDPLATAAPGTAPPKEMVHEAQRLGARRKKLARGEGGFFMNRSQLPPGYRIAPHSHDHSEMLVVLAGGCTVEGGDLEGLALGADDAIVIRANERYGFQCGDEGMEFLTIRTGEATVDPAASGP